MKKVTSAHEIHSWIGPSVDLGSFLMSSVVAGQEVDSVPNLL